MASTFELPAPIERLSLFLDFDGTLVPIASNPDAIEVPRGLVALLHRVSQRLEGRLVLVSGRMIADLDGHLGPHAIAVAGSHGHELRLAGGGTAEQPLGNGLSAIRTAVEERRGEMPGVEIELKRYGVALHYRQAPELADRVRILAEDIAGALGLSVKHGKMVAEILPGGADKGKAVQSIMERAGFAGTVPVFVGDDITDEDGFGAVQRLGGLGVLVGDRDASEAGARLSSHREVWQLLERIAAGNS